MFERHIIAVQTVGTTPSAGSGHHVFGVEHIRQPRNTYRQEETGIGILVRLVIVFCVIGIQIRQSGIVGTERIDEVMARLVEIATAVRHARYIRYNQAIRPVEVAVLGTIVHGILHSPDTLNTVLILRFGTEVVVEIRLQSVSAFRIDSGIGIFDYLLQILLVDLGHLVGTGVVLTVSLVEIDLRQERSRSRFGRTALIFLTNRQHSISLLQVIGNHLPSLVIRILGIGESVVLIGGHIALDDERDVLVEPFEQEMTVRTEEIHLAETLLLEFVFCLIRVIQHVDSRINTTQTVVQAHPHIVDIPVGGQDAFGDLQLVEHITVGGTVTALVGVVRADIEIPHREGGVNILRGDEHRICGNYDIIHILRVGSLFQTERSLRLVVIEKRVTGSEQQSTKEQSTKYYFIHCMFHNFSLSI